MHQKFSKIEDLDTPCIVIDLDVTQANIKSAQDYFSTTHLKLRPHIKTHKLPSMAKLQLDAGANGITCQKISEAEVFADAGIEDILITYNIMGEFKLNRLAELAARTKLKVVADSEYVVDGLASLNIDIKILVECDTGQGRNGVQTPEAALKLALYIEEKDGVQFDGLMTYPSAGKWIECEAFCSAAKALCVLTIGHCKTVSIGGTPDMRNAHIVKSATEHRPGTYIYNDKSLINRDDCEVKDCALTVLAQIVSRPTDDRGIMDACSKALTSDLFGLTGHGMVREYPDAVIYTLSEEHGHIDFSGCAQKPKVGEKINIIPNHVCPVVNLFDYAYLQQNGVVSDVLPIAARGKLN